MSCIDIRELGKQWGLVVAVDKVSFTVVEGSLTVLLGPSGCGKSTILRLIAGLETVSSGSIFIGGKEVTHMDPAKRGVSMVFQSYALFPHLNVRENIIFGLKVRGISATEREARLRDATRMVGLNDLLNRKPSQLSGGQRQRVALARSIVSRRRVCLMDEPLSNLDAKLRAEMRDEIRSLQQKLGLTMVYVTHDQVEAMTMADQVVLLKKGRVEQTGRPHELYERPQTTFAAQFMGSPPMNLLNLELIEDRFVQDVCGGILSAARRTDMIIGVRPEHVKVGQDGLPVQVSATDYLGAETVLRLSHGGQTLFGKIEGHQHYLPGEQLHVSWPEKAVHRFGPDGFRIEDPQRVSFE
ncbi:ABC transporter ATP-binding protein [Desulfosarcina sp.]|uniref:ABC transporter ATP-binding protein n=1 Tax=Desulfosarcina sp. TaxID=2027861 RepID=UPI00397088C3